MSVEGPSVASYNPSLHAVALQPTDWEQSFAPETCIQ